MEEYKSNSHKSKELATELQEKRVKSVVSGPVRTKKKSEIRKFTDIFVAEDISSVKSFICSDVLVPAVKKAIYDIVTNGIDMILYSGNGSGKSHSSGSKISYSKYYKDRDYARETSRSNSRNGFDYDDIIFENRGDAEMVLSTMEDMIDRYGFVSVADFYDLAEVTNPNYMANKYGWVDVRNASIVRNRNGYVIKLPRALPLD